MQKAPSCPCCGHGFGAKDGGHVSPHGSRLPLLLQCGHTVCEGCLTKLCRSETSYINCPLCQIPMSLGEGGVKALMVDAYSLGMITLSKRVSMDRLKSQITFQLPDTNSSSSSMKKKETKAPKRDVCVECSTKAATCRCDKCETILCATCFDKVHKSSRTLRMHHALPIQDNITGGIPTICTKHDNRPIEYFCDDDQTPICSHCVIMGDHKGHAITAMEVMNKNAFSSLEPAIENATVVLQRMKRSEKLLNSTLPSVKADLQRIMVEISAHFRHAHGLLQTRETQLIENLVKMYDIHGSPVEQLRTKLQNNMWNLEQSVKEAKQLLKDSNQMTTCMNAQGLLSKLQESKTLPCFAMKVTDEDTPSLACRFSSDIARMISTHGQLEGDVHVGVSMLSLDEVPTELLDCEAPDDGPQSGAASIVSDTVSVTTDRTVDTEQDSDSVSAASEVTSTSRASSGKSGTRTKPPRKARLVTSELVYVTHIKNPRHFLVQKCNDFSRLKQLQRNISKHCSSPEAVEDIPVDITIDDYVLSQFKGTWYRARVKELLSPESVTAPENTKLEVFYIDYGNTETVLLSNLRHMKSRFMKTPELVKACCLLDIVPANESGQWSQESIHAFARMTADKPMQMLIKSEEDDMLYVDLSKPGCDDIEDDRPISVRDALVFLGHACFATSVSTSGNSMPVPHKQYFKANIPCKGTKVPCMVSFVQSPHKFFIQLINEDVQYMHEMMTNIQYTYTQDTKDLYTIFCPQKDMVCAAHYQSDDTWYRAQVIDLPGRSKVKVKYVDYGNEDFVTNWKLQKLLDKFMVLPVQAMCCELTDVAPLDMEVGWSQESILKFVSEVTTRKMQILVKNVHSDMVLEVILTELLEPEDVGVVEPVCFNRWLVEQGLAVSTGFSSRPLPPNSRSSTRSSSLEFVPQTSDIQVVPSSQRLSGFALQQASERAMALSRPPIQPGAAAPKEETTGDQNTEKPSTMEVTVSRIISPGQMYMHLVEQTEDRLKLMEKLGEYFRSTPPTRITAPKVGDSCAIVYLQDKRWYRAEILNVQEDNALVQMVDYGYETTLHPSDLYTLPTANFANVSRFAFLCHLMDVQPAGDPTRWTSTSIEFITDLLKEQVCYIKTENNSQSEGPSVGVDLLKEEIIKGDALTGDRVIYTSVRSLLLDKGLALPKRIIKKVLPKDQKKKAKPIPAKTEDVKAIKPSSSPVPGPAKVAQSSTSSSDREGSASPQVVVNETVASEADIIKTVTGPAVKSIKQEAIEVPDAGELAVESEDKESGSGLIQKIDIKVKISDSTSDKLAEVEPSDSKTVDSGDTNVLVSACSGSSVDPGVDSSPYNVATLEADYVPSSATNKIHNDGVALKIEVDKDSESKTNNESALSSPDSNVIVIEPLEGSEDGSVVGDGSLGSRKEIGTPPPLAIPKEQLAPSPPVELQNYKVANLPMVSKMAVVPTYVDFDCHMFVQSVKPDDDPEGRLGFVLKENTIEVKLQNSYFEKMNLQRAKIIRDGNCLFRACAQSILNDQNRHAEVRTAVVDTLVEYWFLFEEILGGVSKNEYLESMSLDGAYGGEPEIQAICFAYHVQIKLFMGGLQSPIKCRNYGQSTDVMIQLSYVSDGAYDYGHYDLVVESDAEAEVAEVVYGEWRAEKVRDYQLSNRTTNNNLYENSILDQLMVYLQTKYTASPPEPDVTWHVGQAIVAQYGDDNLFYRARIIDILTNGYKVKYMDFGNEEILPVARLRSEIALVDIPIQCYECVIDQLIPGTEDGKWTVLVLNSIHEFAVGKTFVMHIKDAFDDNKLLVDFEDEDHCNIAHRICELGLGTLDDQQFDIETISRSTADGPRSSSPLTDVPTSAEEAVLEVLDSSMSMDLMSMYGIPVRKVPSPYPDQIQLRVDDCVPCAVTQVDYPNVVYLQRVQQEDADEADMLAINNQLNQLLEVQEIVNTDYVTYKPLPQAKPGMSCCAQYSLDQCWYRVEILSVGHGPKHDLCGVLFVDYGSSEYIPTHKLLELPQCLMKLPIQAVKCHLAGVSSTLPDHSWDPNVALRMTEIVASQSLMTHVKACGEHIEVDLYPRDQFFAIGLDAPLVYSDLIRSGDIRYEVNSQEQDSEAAIIEEIYEEDFEAESSVAPPKPQLSWAELAEMDDDRIMDQVD